MQLDKFSVFQVRSLLVNTIFCPLRFNTILADLGISVVVLSICFWLFFFLAYKLLTSCFLLFSGICFYFGIRFHLDFEV